MSAQPAILCETCLLATTTRRAVLCERCAVSFRVLVVPRTIAPWGETAREAEGEDGIEGRKYIAALLTRVHNQQREIASLHKRLTAYKDQVDGEIAAAMRTAYGNDHGEHKP